jgi:hypothetical protein
MIEEETEEAKMHEGNHCHGIHKNTYNPQRDDNTTTESTTEPRTFKNFYVNPPNEAGLH